MADPTITTIVTTDSERYMPFDTKCTKCHEILDEPGALVFSPPFATRSVTKYHLCADCYGHFLDWLNGVEEVATPVEELVKELIPVSGPLPPSLPVAFGNCNCSCHTVPGVNHVAPCCYNMPGDAAYDFYNKGI